MIERVSTRGDGIVSRRAGRRVTAVAAGVLATSLTLGACGGSGEPEVEAAIDATTTSISTTTSTIAPATTTTVPRTTTTQRATTTTSTTTSTSTTTTTTLLPQESEPIAPPRDAHASEPVIELGRIVIPKIGVDMEMYEGIRLTTLDYGPGHWPGSAMPGQAGNVVVGGHRTSKHKVFRDVDQLVAGDEIIFRDAAGEHVYQVSRIEIVDPSAVWIIDPTETPTATLFACHPPGSTAQRIVVFADLVV